MHFTIEDEPLVSGFVYIFNIYGPCCLFSDRISIILLCILLYIYIININF